ncbi:MAG TPA: cyclic nucleotide-binding domain-containing protein, partial [Clostridia bacterium]|nr:cyclic nucleotide-binding domain-containing protein [Clostridia bacterium]
MNSPFLPSCPLFAGIKDASLKALLQCLAAREAAYPKEDLIFLAGERPETVGILLSGSAHVVHEDFWGNRTILSYIGPGDLFGEAFSCAEAERLPVSVVAVEPSTVLLINVRKILTTCSTACVYHAGLIKNL